MSMTESQQARQERMINVASSLAQSGGYDAVQMRTVANEADVALGTLYRYFPSKEHLLVSAMLKQTSELSSVLVNSPAKGDSAADRVIALLAVSNAALKRQQNFTVAVVRSLASGDDSVAPVVREVRELMSGMILSAIGSKEPSEREELVSQILQELWLSALVAWISGVEPFASVDTKLGNAARLLLSEGDDS